jgi:pyruvate/2-oxoglutarate dehydrogenase complex dihydrolipoamide dehydrogenase (E3) component
MPETTHYDAIIIGSGQGGNPLAAALSEKGKRTAMIERAAVGGTCVNYGCTPTKTMVASAEVAYLARRAKDYGVDAGDVSIDMPAVRERKRNMVKSWREGSERSLETAEFVDLIRGEASFLGPKQVLVQMNDGGERVLTADLIVINAGLSTSVPDLKGLESVCWLDNASVMELDVVPEHLVVLGGGYVGLEFAQMFRRFGSRVTLIHHSQQLLPIEDADIAGEVAKILEEDGIEILLEAKAESVTSSGTGMTLTVSYKGESKAVEGSHLLIATGRRPNTEKLNLAAAGIATDAKGFVSVNDRLETSVPGVYGLGDVKGGPAFTHVSYDDYRILKANLLEGGDSSKAGRVFPYCVFIDPQLGRIGLSEKEAVKLGKKVRVARLPMTSVARAVETSRSRGFMTALVDPETEQILGAAILGEGGGEIMSMIQIAMMGKLKYTVLRDADLAHPTLAESLNNLFSNFQPD